MLTADSIRRARQLAGLTQAELAARLGVDVKTVNNWETGRTAPRSHEPALQRELTGYWPEEQSATVSEGLSSDELMELVYLLGQRAEREAKVTGEVPTLKELLLRQIQEEQSLAARDKGRPSRGAQLRDDTEGDD